jgi:transcriptional regulator with XRE-family HTH domain
VSTRAIPAAIKTLPLGSRIRWARKAAGLSHDRLIERLGRSNRSHLVKIEQGVHIPRPDLRDAIADATSVPRDLFQDDDEEESDPVASLMGALRRVVRDEVLRQA